jgi:hypothetical protein
LAIYPQKTVINSFKYFKYVIDIVFENELQISTFPALISQTIESSSLMKLEITILLKTFLSSTFNSEYIFLGTQYF